jgi:serine phosphatase RsbU (regulator of sigma subunit)
MIIAHPPANEAERLASLRRYEILDTEIEAEFEEITQLISRICHTPISLITLLDESRQWFKSRVGLPLAETSRDYAFCAHAIRGNDLFQVHDTHLDPRFCENPLVTGAPNIRFYAGMPLTTPEGYNLGTLCVIDREPRELTNEQMNSLRILARQVITQLELRLHLRRAEWATAELEAQKKLVEEKNAKILASITYGGRIQQAVMPSLAHLHTLFPEAFVLFRPRDIVSGDTYWCSKRGHKVLLAAIDCTGHGVPGALLSMLAQSMLNEIVNVWGITSPDLILYELHGKVRQILNQSDGTNHDGMEISLCVIDRKEHRLACAGAGSARVMVQDGQLREVKADKHSIGGLQKEEERLFRLHHFDLSVPSVLYLFSDGYQDQFGGPGGGKFMSKRLRDLLHSIHDQPLQRQQQILAGTLSDWMGNQRQTDDILVLGVKLSIG